MGRSGRQTREGGVGSVCEMGRGGCEARSLQFSVTRRPLAYAWPWLAWSGVGLALARLTPACVARPRRVARPAARHHQPAGPRQPCQPQEARRDLPGRRCAPRAANVWPLLGPHLSTQPFPRTTSSALEGPGLTRGLTILRARHPLTPAARSNVSDTILSTGNPPPGANADDDDDEDVPDLVDNFEEASK